MIDIYQAIEKSENQKVGWLTVPTSWEYKLINGILTSGRVTTRQLPHVIKIIKNYPLEPKIRAKADGYLANNDFGFAVEQSREIKSHVSVCDYNKILIMGNLEYKFKEAFKSTLNYEVSANEIVSIVCPKTYPRIVELLALPTVTYDDEVLDLLANLSSDEEAVFNFDMETGNNPLIHIILEEQGLL